MEYVTLNNGVKMPMAGIGTFLLSPDEAEASVLSALQCGYRLIDTANAYVNEKAVGRAMKRSGLKREEIFDQISIARPVNAPINANWESALETKCVEIINGETTVTDGLDYIQKVGMQLYEDYRSDVLGITE